MSEEVFEILEASGAILTNDHFVLSSWRHSSSYVAKQRVLVEPEHGWTLSHKISELEEVKGVRVETVIGPVAGAVSLAYLTALHIGRRQGNPIRAIYAEKGEGETYFVKSEFEGEVRDRLVLVVDDILSTGHSVLEVISAVRAMGGYVVGLAVICNRGGVTRQQTGDVPFIASLVEVTMETWDEADCALCRSGIPVNQTFGRGKEFLAARTAN